MEIRILGPLEVRTSGRLVALGGAKPRAVFAMLALHPNRPVAAERLAVAIWGEDAPPSAVRTVQVYVSRLRKELGDPAALVTTPAGYRLRVRPGELDAERFELQVADGRRALAAGRAEPAAAQLRSALGLWHGPALAEFASAPFAPPEIARLEEQHLAAVELRVDADLAAGRHAEVVGELRRLTRRHPWRERLHAQLMLALYRGGRQAEALEAYGHAREVLVGQLGIEPGSALHELHAAILAQDPQIAAPPATDGPAAGARGGRPAPATQPGHRELPAPPTRTFGRERELAAVAERLRERSVRLVTLTGPGGVGKTRLALEVARTVEADFGDGARFVSLTAVSRAEHVPAALLRTLGITMLAGESPRRAVERFLGAKHLLLVADNFEHVLAAAPFVGDLLDACPALTVLATSREPLALRAEQRHPVPPLALPDPGACEDLATLAGVAAVALFSERARAHDPDFDLGANVAAVAEICRRVDGLPLAIELAAARCGLLTPGEIAERLVAALGSPGAGARDAPARQQTLRATIDWSHDLLTEDEKACFARFAVFAGAPGVEAAEAITGAHLDTLDRLVAKSLLVRHRPAQETTRLRMLETIRAYATERLAASTEGDAMRERHHRHYLALALRHGTDRALWGTSHREHLVELDAATDELDGALAWAIQQPDAEPALSLCAALGWYWQIRDSWTDAVEWSGRALGLPHADAHPALCVRVLCIEARGLLLLGRGDEEPAVMARPEAMARKLADPVLLSQVLENRAVHEAVHSGRLDVAETLADEALWWASAAPDDWAIAMAARAHAMAAQSGKERGERVERAASLLERTGNLYHLASLLASSAYEALGAGSDDDAREFVARALPIAQRLDNPHLWMLVRGNVALSALLAGDIDAARLAFCDELRLCRELVVLTFASEGLGGLAAVASVRGDTHRAARLVGAAAALRCALPEGPVDARLEAAFFRPARAGWGVAAWDAAHRDGAALSFEDAIAYALEEPRGSGPDDSS